MLKMNTKKPANKSTKRKKTNVKTDTEIIKDEIVDYARSLYLTLDEKCNKKYSNIDIIKLIELKYNREYSRMTIGRWAEKGKWDDDFVKIKTRALELSKIQPKEKKDFEAIKKEAEFDIDKELIDNQAENLALIYNNAKERYILASEFLKNRMLCISEMEYKGERYFIDINAPYAAIVKMIEGSEAVMLKLLDSKKDEGALIQLLSRLPEDALQKLLKNFS